LDGFLGFFFFPVLFFPSFSGNPRTFFHLGSFDCPPPFWFSTRVSFGGTHPFPPPGPPVFPFFSVPFFFGFPTTRVSALPPKPFLPSGYFPFFFFHSVLPARFFFFPHHLCVGPRGGTPPPPGFFGNFRDLGVFSPKPVRSTPRGTPKGKSSWICTCSLFLFGGVSWGLFLSPTPSFFFFFFCLPFFFPRGGFHPCFRGLHFFLYF